MGKPSTRDADRRLFHHAINFFRCGEPVREKDGRHVGKITAMFDRMVKVVWEETGWISFLDFDDLERADDGRQYLLEA